MTDFTLMDLFDAQDRLVERSSVSYEAKYAFLNGYTMSEVYGALLKMTPEERVKFFPNLMEDLKQ